MSTAASDAAADRYACHYCGRTDGSRTRDHVVPRFYGGSELVGNIVICCMMCNMIKSARPYGLFVVLFKQFLEAHGAEYHATNPDDFQTIGAMSRRFNKWLHALQHAPVPA
jgi:5-methylcytosine-specific restriction endonuclease McrA